MKDRTHQKIELALYYLLKAIILLSVPVALLKQEWATAFYISLIFLSTFIPTVLKRQYRLYMPVTFDLYASFFIFVSLFLGEIHDYYFKIWWWDLYTHLQGGILLGLGGFILVYVLNEQRNISVHMKPGFISFFALTFAIAFGVAWEIFEFFMDNTFGLNMQKSGLVDTMWDLIFGAGGALITATLGYFWLKKWIHFTLFDRSVSNFVRKNKFLFKEW